MSWVQDEWKDGLNQKVLMNISSLENQNEKLKKEAKQKQFQLESLEAAFSKQRKRAEDEKSEITILKRECQSLTEVCSKLECKVEKLTYELRSKESYASNIEGQLQRCRTQLDQFTNKTPKHNRKEGGTFQLNDLKARMEEVEALLQQEKLRNKNLEKEMLDIKTKPPSATASSYKSSLPWATDDCTSPLRSSKPTVVDLLTGSPLAGAGDAQVSSQSSYLQPNLQNDDTNLLKQQLEASKHNNEELSSKIKNLQEMLSVQEKEMRKKCTELTTTQAKMDEVYAKVSECERKLKYVTDELSCERHNGESVRNSLQSKLTKQEKNHQREITRTENSARDLENQLRNAKQELNLELSQCRSELQQVRSELDRTGSNCNKLDNEVKKAKQQITQLQQMKQIDEKKILELDSSLKATTKERDLLCQRCDFGESARNELEARYNSLDKELKSNQRQLNCLEQQLDKKLVELEDCKKRAETTAKNNAVCIDNLKSKLCEVEKKKSEAEKAIKNNQKAVAGLNTKMIETEHKLTESSQQFHKLQTSFESATQEKRTLADKLEASAKLNKQTELQLTKNNERHQSEMQRLKNDFREESESFKRKLSDTQQSSQAELSSLMKKHSSEIDLLKSKTEEKHEEMTKLESALQEKESELKAAVNQLETVTADGEKLRMGNEELTVQKKQLKFEAEEAQSHACDVKKRLEAVTKELETLRKQHQSLEHHHSLVVQESKENKVERQYLDGRVQDLEKQVEEFGKKDVTSSVEVELEEARKCEKELLEKIAILERDSATKSRELDAIVSEKSQLNENLLKYSQDKENIAKELLEVTSSIESRISEYESAIKDKDNALESLQKNRDKILSDKDLLTEEVERAKTSQREIDEENQNLKEVVAQLKLTLSKKEDEVVKLYTNHENLSLKSEKLQLEVNQKRTKLEQLHAAEAETSEKLNHFAELYNKAQEEVNEMRDTIKAAACDIQVLSEQKKKLIAENETLNEKVEAETAELQSEVDKLKNFISKMNVENESLRENLQDAESLVQLHQERLNSEKEKHEKVVENLNLSLTEAQKRSDELASDVESLKLSLEEITNEKRSCEDMADHRLSLIRDYKDQIETLANERNDVRKTYQLAQNELTERKVVEDDLKKEVCELQQIVEAKNVKNLELNAECDRSKTSLSELEEKYVKICKDLAEKAEEIAELEGELEMVQQNVNVKTSEIALLSEDQQKAKTRIVDELKSAEAEKASIQSELSENSEKLKSANNIAEKLKFEKQELVRKLSDLRIESQKIAGNLELMQMDMEDKDLELQTLQTVTIPGFETTLNEKNREIEELESGKTKMKEQIERLSYENKEILGEKSSLSARISDLMSERGQLENEYKSLKSQVETLQETNLALSEEAEVITGSLSMEILSKKELESSLVECTANIAQYLYEISELKKCVSELKNENQTLVEESEQLNEDLKQKTEALEEKCSQIQSFETRIEKLEENLEAVQKECGERVEKAEDECEELHSNMKELRQVAGQAQWKVGNLENLYDRISQDNARLRQENESLISDINIASRTLMDLEDQLDEAERKLEERTESDDVIANLRTEIESLTNAKEELEVKLLKISEELDVKTCECDGLTEEGRDVQLQFANLEQNATNCLNNFAETADSEEVLKKELNEVKQQAVTLRSELEENITMIDELQDEYRCLTIAHQKMLDEKSAEIISLQAQVNELSKQLANKGLEQNNLEENINDLHTREGLVKQCGEQLQCENQSLKKQLAAAEFAIEKNDSNNEELTKKLFEAENALKNLRLSTDNQLTAVKNKSGVVEVELKNITRDKAEVDLVLQQKLEEIASLQLQASKATEVVKKLSCEKFALEETVQSLLKDGTEGRLQVEHVASQVNQREIALEAKERFCCDQALQIRKLLEDVCQSRNEKDEKTMECEKLQTDLTAKDTVCLNLRSVLVNLEKKLEEVQTCLREIVVERDSLKMTVVEKEGEVEELQSNNEQLRSSIRDIKQTFGKSEQNLAEKTRSLRQEVGVLQEKLQKATNQLDKLENSLDSKVNEIGDLQNQLSASNETNLNLRNEIENVETKLLESTDQIESLSAQIQVCHQLVQSKSKEVDLLNKELHSARDELAAAIETAQTAKNQYEQDVHSLNVKLEQLSLKLAQKSQLVDRLQQEKTAESALLESVKSELNKERELLDHEKQQHAADVTKFLEKCDTTNRELEVLKSVVEQLKTKDVANSALIEEERKKINEFVQENLEISALLEASVRDNGALYEQINDLTWQLTEYRQDSRCKIEKLQTLSCDRENIATQNTKLTSQFERLTKENEHLQAQISEISAKYQRSEMEQQNLNSSLNAMGLSISGLEEKFTVTTLKNASEVSTLENKVSSLNNEIAALEMKHKESLDAIDVEMDELKSQRCELKEDLKELKRQRKLKNKEIIELQDQLSVTSLKLSELTPKFEHLTATTEQLKTALNSKSSELSDVLNVVSMKDSELDAIRSELASGQHKHVSELEDRNSKITMLNEELVKLRMDLENTIQTLTVAEKSAENEKVKISELEKKFMQKKEEVLKYHKSNENLIEEKKLLLDKQSELENVRQNLSEIITKIEANLHACHDNYGIQIADLELRVSTQQKEADIWKSREKEMKAEITNHLKANDELQLNCSEGETKLQSCHSLIEELQRSQKSYVDTIALSEKELAKLRHEHDFALEEKQKLVEQLQADNTSLSEELSRMKEQLSDLNMELNRLKHDAISSCDEIIRLNNEVRRLNGEAARLDEEASRASKKANRLSDDLKRLKNEESQHKSEIDELKGRVSSMESENCRLHTELKSGNFNMQDIEKKLEQCGMMREEERKVFEEQFQQSSEAIAGLETKSKKLESELESKGSQLSDVLNTVSLKDSELDTLRSELESVQLKQVSELEERDAKIIKLEKKFQQSLDIIDELESKNTLQSDELSQLNDVIAHLRNDATSSSDEISQLNYEIARLKEDATSLNDEIARLKNDATSSNDKISQLNGEICRFKKDATTFCDKISRLNDEIAHMKEGETTSNDEISQLNDEIARLKESETSSNDKTSQLNDEIARLKKGTTSSNDKISQLNDEISRLKEDETSSNDEISQLNDEIARLKNDATSFSDKISRINDEIDRLKKDTIDSNDEISLLKDKITNLNTEIADSNEETAGLKANTILIQNDSSQSKSECSRLRSSLHERDLQLEQLQDDNRRLREDNEFLTEKIKTKEKQIEDGRGKLTMLETVLAETSLTNNQMSEKLKSLNDAISADSARYKKRIAQLCGDNEALLESFSTLKRSAKALQVEKDVLLQERSENFNRIKRLQEEGDCLADENQRLKLNVGELEREGQSLKSDVRSLGESAEELEEALEQLSLQNGDLEERLKDLEGILEETSLAMEDLRLKLDEERTKVTDQQQMFAFNENKSRSEISALHCDVESLRDRIAAMEEEHGEEINEIKKSHDMRENELTAYSQQYHKQFEILMKEVQDLETRNSALETELLRLQNILVEAELRMESLKQDRDLQAEQARSRFAEVVTNFEKFQRDIDSSSAEKCRLREQIVELEEDVKTVKSENERLLVNLENENGKLKKETETLRSKLTLMTSTARRKEKELHRALSMLSGKKDKQADQASSSDSNHPSVSSQYVTIKRSRPKRSSRKSAKLEKIVVSHAPEAKSSPKETRPIQDSSPGSSPVYQVEGLPHLVNKGFTNIPHGFSSPFVLRRHQMNQTKQLLASAITRKNKDDSKDSVTKEDIDPFGFNEKPPMAPPRGELRHKSESESKCSLSPDVNSEPLQTVTNSPNHQTFSPPHPAVEKTKQLRLGLSKSPSRMIQDDDEQEVDCKVQ